MQRLQKAVDPSGMGIVKAPLTLVYAARGDSWQDASRKAGNVDAFVGVLDGTSPPRLVLLAGTGV